MAITQTQTSVAQISQTLSAPQRGVQAAWAGDIAVQLVITQTANLLIPRVPGVVSVGTALPSFPLLPGASAISHLAGLPKNTVVTKTPFTVRGLPFGDRPLADYVMAWGATVTAASADQRVYVIDFHGLRTIRNITVIGGGSLQIRPWEGVKFGAPMDVSAHRTLDLLTQKVEVTLTNPLSQAAFEGNTHIDCLSYPSNVRFVIAQGAPVLDASGNPTAPTIRDPSTQKLFALASIPFAQAIGKEPILWTYNGDLAGRVTLPDFSRELNDFLESCPAQAGLCFPHLIAYSDTPGFLELVEVDGSPFVSLNYLATIEFPDDDPLSTSVAFQRHGDVQTIDLVLFRPRNGQFITPAGVDPDVPHVSVQKVQFAISGALNEDRLDPDAHWTDRIVPASARVSTVFSLAQPLTLQGDRRIAGLDLYLSAISTPELLLELQGDRSGMPDGHALASAVIDGSTITAEAKWVSVRFADPVSMTARQTVWAVLKASAGEANWLADAGGDETIPRLRFSRDGAFWSTHEPPLIGLHKLKVALPISERPAPLSLDLLNRVGIPLQPSKAPQTAVVLFENGAHLQGNQISLRLIPEAAGEIRLASVVIEYVPTTEMGA
ncbi:MAG: hypothetical protein RML36_09280 [Anaerolineae bacterium]|nr:hypothetical protein [Anaerolineae bacterium]MDW8099658.1 hypothetical protein [Anaerolineae bacterium]